MEGERERGALKLFGVQIFRELELQQEDPDDQEEVIRKSASMGNLVSCAAAVASAANGDNSGYHSDGGLLKSARKKRRSAAAASQERKRGVPWTEEEHRTFLIGLERLGKGDWRGISRNFVPTRTPTQVASHAQKYFLRQSNPSKKKRRSSLFDVQLSNKVVAPETSTPFAVKPSEVIQEENFTVSPYSNMVPSAGIFTNIGNGPSLYNSYEKADISSGNKEPVLSLAPVIGNGNSLQYDTPAVDSTSLELSIALPNSLAPIKVI